VLKYTVTNVRLVQPRHMVGLNGICLPTEANEYSFQVTYLGDPDKRCRHLASSDILHQTLLEGTFSFPRHLICQADLLFSGSAQCLRSGLPHRSPSRASSS